MAAASGMQAVTVLYDDRGTPEWAPTRVDDERISRMPTPTSSVRCALPVTLRMLTGRPRAVIRELDVCGARAQVGHALPTMAPAWIRMPLPSGPQVVPARVVSCTRATPGAPWEIEIKFILPDAELRAGVVGLVRALRSRDRSKKDADVRSA